LELLALRVLVGGLLDDVEGGAPLAGGYHFVSHSEKVKQNE